MSGGDTKGPVPALYLLGVAGLSVVLAAACVGLALREEEQQRHQRAISVSELSSFRAPALPLKSIRQHVAAYRRVSLHGSYDHAHEILLRGREDGGEPGFHVVTPLRVEDGAFLVVRGWIPLGSGTATELARLSEPGEIVVTGFPLPELESEESGEADEVDAPSHVDIASEWPLQVDVVRPRKLEGRLPYRIFRLVVQQLSAPELRASPMRLSEPDFNSDLHARRATGLYVAAALLGAVFGVALLLLLRRRR